MLWLLCSLPLVTLGASTTALYDSAVHSIRYGEDSPYSRFFRTFRNEWKLAALSNLVWFGLVAVGFVLLTAMESLGAGLPGLHLAATVYLVILILIAVTGFWSFLILSRFQYTFLQLTETAIRLALGYIPITLFMMITFAGTLWLCLAFWLPVMFLPAMLMLLWSLPVERVFKKYGGEIKISSFED